VSALPEALAAPVVDLEQVSRRFPGPPPVHALRDVDLRIEVGEYVSIVGPSGSGKSTLLHLVGLLDQPTGGTYRLDGVDTSTLSEAVRAALRGRRIGFVFQAFHLLAHRTVLDNVILATLYNGVPRRTRRARAERALHQVGLAHRLQFSPGTLSGGERQRVAIARALVAGPSLLLADEPTGNLDTATGDEVMESVERLWREQGLTVILVTHDRAIAERAPRVIEMRDGSIVRSADAAMR